MSKNMSFEKPKLEQPDIERKLETEKNEQEISREESGSEEEKGIDSVIKEQQKRDDEEKMGKVRAELWGIESKEAEPKISMEQRIAELDKQEEELSKEVQKAWKEFITKGPSLKTLKGWTEIITQESHNKRLAKFQDARDRMRAITDKRIEMEKRCDVYSRLEEALEKGYTLSSLSVEQLLEGVKVEEEVSQLIESLRQKESGEIAGTTLTREKLRTIADKLRVNDAESFENERREKIREASKNLSDQFEEQNIEKGMKVKLDTGKEGWLRLFDREGGIIELWDKPSLNLGGISRYDVREIKKVEIIKESKAEKVSKKVSKLF